MNHFEKWPHVEQACLKSLRLCVSKHHSPFVLAQCRVNGNNVTMRFVVTGADATNKDLAVVFVRGGRFTLIDGCVAQFWCNQCNKGGNM